MAKKKQSDSVHRVLDVVGVSDKSWEDAGRRAVETAAGSLRDLRVAEVTKNGHESEGRKGLGISHARCALVQIRGLIPNFGSLDFPSAPAFERYKSVPDSELAPFKTD